ncbi:PIF1-like helicase-domain-containing protein, partial [Lyophyllum atratum]
MDPTDDDIYDYGLHLLEKNLEEHGKSLQNFPPMPLPRHNWDVVAVNPLIAEQLDYDRNAERERALERFEKFNDDQLAAYNEIMNSIQHDLGGVFFLNGAGGCGKTYVYTAIAHMVRSEGWIILCVGSSGISALLLPGGRTAHSMFKIPVDTLTDQSFCAIPKQSLRAALLRETRAII